MRRLTDRVARRIPEESSSRWRSPIRGPWLTSMFGMVLLVALPVEMVTGLLSYAAYNPKLEGNDPNPAHGLFGAYLFDWFTSPNWLYQAIEGVHVAVGLAMVPFVLAKLWSVMPQLFEWPPFRSIAHFLERLTLVMLVGGILFEMATGILNIDYVQSSGTAFYTGHFYGAWLFFTAFVVHVVLRLGRARTALGRGRTGAVLRTDLHGTQPDPGPRSATMASPTISRRGALAMVAGSSLAVMLLTAGEAFGKQGVLAFLGTRNRSPDTGANDFPVNHTASSKGITAEDVGPAWRLELVGKRRVSLSRPELMSMRDIDATLPLTCTEGWSTVQRWGGVRLSTLAGIAGVPKPAQALLETMDQNTVLISAAQVAADESMLALHVNGADLSLDHGYPARMIIPSAPGTHNKKWMARITFEEAP